MRKATVKRKTKETDIEVAVDLDGTGASDDRDRHRLPRPHAGSAGAPFAHRHHRQGQGRPAHRPPPHRRGCRHRARPGGEAGARRHEGHHPLCRRASADGRGADARRDRHFRPAVPGVQGRVRARQGRRRSTPSWCSEWFQAFAHECRHHAARRDALRHQRPPYRRNPASRGWRGRCARRSRSIRAPRARSRRPRARSAAEPAARGASRDRMAVYTVHAAAAARTTTRSPIRTRFVFVRDGFYFWAFLLGAAVDAVAPAVAGAARAMSSSRRVAVGAALAVGVPAARVAGRVSLLALADRARGREPAALDARAARLDAMLGVVVGRRSRRRRAALLRRLGASGERPPPRRADAAACRRRRAPSRAAPTDVIGLFPEPGAPR